MRKLLVEGADDQHVLWAVLARRGLPEVFTVDEAGGYEKLLTRLPVEVKASELERFGVIIDADLDAKARWDALRAAFRKSGFRIPTDPVVGGFVDTQNEIRIGAWLMPDNVLPGMLEDFVALLVPADDEVWPISTAFVEGLAESPQRYRDCHLAKAKIHGWLAVQDTPGSPMGQAITKKLLSVDSVLCDDFIEWLKEVFVGN